ncbi:ankyrin repeat domain-containing protein [Legionella sp. CNM-4043-24]|uniref:ankyrin repeat domain-containing protein n=1 Tax=Legionella sp. CNM-4043-24 TaxID=3421646 RepID=UPI00403AF18A
MFQIPGLSSAQSARVRLLKTLDPKDQALFTAVIHRNKEEVENQITLGANVNCLIDRYYPVSILYEAVNYSSFEVVQVLINSGADVNFKFDPKLPLDGGKSVLHLAVWRQKEEMVDLLLKHGSLTDVTDRLGNTPLSLAQESNNKNIIDLLMHAMPEQLEDFSSEQNIIKSTM